MNNPDSTSTISVSTILRAVLMTSLVVIILFLAFEVVEYVWLSDLDMEELHRVYLLRGLSISLVAIGLVGWMIVKASNPLLKKEEWAQGDRPINKERLANFNSWFIMMRWVAIAIAGVLVYVIVRVNEWLPREVWWPLMITILCLAALNIVYTMLVGNGNLDEYLLSFQAYADLIILTVMLHFSGGIENPLTLIMIIHIFIAGIVLSHKHLYAITLTAIVLLLIMAIGEATSTLSHYTLNIFPHFEHEGAHIHAAHQPVYVTSHVGLMITIFLLAAYFIGTIMERIRTDERQLEKFADQSLEQRQLIEKSLNTTGTGLCVCDNKGKPFWINPIWESWFGKKSIDCVKAVHGEENPEYVSEVLNDGITRSTELRVEGEGADTKTKVFLITTAPLYDKDNNIDHAVSLAKDITDQKEAQEKMMRAGKLAAVGELAGKVAHEVNNPIGILSAKCRLLLSNHSEEMSENVAEELVKITDAADRVSDIAQGLLSYCRPSPASRKIMNIKNSIDNALAMVEQSAKRNGVDIVNYLPEVLPDIIGNTDEMQQVFLNLFLNAMDAMPEGGKLEIGAEVSHKSGNSAPETLAIEIQDNGYGIPEEIIDDIFEPFFTTKDEGKGTGLGLSICSGLIRTHGGTIEVESKMGTGTRIIIKLPTISDNAEED